MPRRPLSATACLVFSVLATTAAADGPSDNVPGAVRRVPKPGISVALEVRNELEAGLADLKHWYDMIPNRDHPVVVELLPDILVLHKAVHDALKYQEFFSEQDVDKARELLALGKGRAVSLIYKKHSWPGQTGLVVRGYRSKIDGSVQPYGLVIPDGPTPPGGFRLDVWFHGRGEVLSEVNFLDDRRKRVGEIAPAGTIVLHPYGRYCNAAKFAGEVDALEAIETVRRNYPIDEDRISVRGFSMGGASAWQFAVHYADRWFAANPGAGFAETPRFLNVFQRETLTPTWYEQKLWRLYDCTDVAENLAQCPTVAYSGELDNQKQAADVMAEALKKEKIDLAHVIGPKTKHAYHPAAKREVERRLASIAAAGRKEFPDEVRLSTYTLKYNRMNWVRVDAMGEHWEKARVHARMKPDGGIDVTTSNVEALTLEFPAGRAPFRLSEPVRVTLDGSPLDAARPLSDRSWSASVVRSGKGWAFGTPGDGPLKRHDLQGPIDDAFMDSFLIVRPTGKSGRAKLQAWAEKEMARAIEHWRRHFRGEPRVKNDTEVTDAEIAGSNLVLWGDPESNALIRKVADKLPVRWDASKIRAGDRAFDAENHVLTLIYPNPLNPNRYVVLNSGFTFRDYDYLNNARQVPKLPDWAVIDLRTPPDSRYPGKVVAADFFGERWELKPEHEHP